MLQAEACPPVAWIAPRIAPAAQPVCYLHSRTPHCNFSSTAWEFSPNTFTILCLDVCPRSNSIRLRGQSSVSASKRIKASFAAASTGGAVTLIRNSLPNTSPTALVDARGCNLIDKTTPSGCSWRKLGEFMLFARRVHKGSP